MEPSKHFLFIFRDGEREPSVPEKGLLQFSFLNWEHRSVSFILWVRRLVPREDAGWLAQVTCRLVTGGWGLFGLCLLTPSPLPAEAILLWCSMLTWSQEGMDWVGWTGSSAAAQCHLLPHGLPLTSPGLRGIHRQVGKADEPFCFLWGGHYTCHRPWVKFLSAEHPSSEVLPSNQPKPLIWALGVKSLPMTFKPKAS